MKTTRYIVGVVLISVFLVGQFHTAARAQTGRIEQYVSPKECVKEIIDNGVTTQVILSPKECEELLHPASPDPPKEPETTNPPVVVEQNGQKGLHGPNTGFMQKVTDAVVENRDVIFFGFVVAGLLLYVAAVRRFSRSRTR